MTDEIIRADPAVRRKTFLALALIAVAAMGGYFWLWPRLAESLLQGTPEERLQTLSWLLVGLFSPCFVFAGYLMLLSLRIARSGQYPPPGMKVVKDTPLLRGAQAARMGRLLAAITGLLMVVGVAGAIWLPWIFLNRFLTRYTG